MNQKETIELIVAKYGLDLSKKSPIEFRLSRWGGLTGLWRELGFMVGAEIGVEAGLFSKQICKDIPDVHLYGIDPWLAYNRYRDHVSQPKLDKLYDEARSRLEPYDVTLIRETSLKGAEMFADGSLDFVFVDGNHHFDFVAPDIIAWTRKVRPGGIVSGHDYRGEDKDERIPFHVIQAVNAYTDAHKIKPWFVIRGDKSASWFWVN